jgi:hypothetical protein
MRVEFIEAFYMGIPLAILIKFIHAWLHNDIFPNKPYRAGSLIRVMAVLSLILSVLFAIIIVLLKQQKRMA